MFTGLIEEIGYVLKKSPSSGGVEWILSASSAFLQDVAIGDSINVAGICQTVTALTNTSFSFYSSPTTIQKTTLGSYNLRQATNMEKALKVGSRLGGHFVYGHVQDKGKILSISHNGNTIQLVIEVPNNLADLTVKEGSIAIDGVSLTINDKNENHLNLQIIPHSWTTTTLHLLKPGNYVNLEIDPLMKMVWELLKNHTSSKAPSSLEKTLRENHWIS